MKKILFTASLLISLSSIYAQNCPATDSTSAGPGNGNDVFYSLKNGATNGNGFVKASPNNNWHMAISVQWSAFPNNPANGVAIRVNSTLGENPQTGATGTRLVKLPGANPTDWRNIDTTDLYKQTELVDSDSTWNLSAFTSGYPKSGPFNFIWGTYNQNNHNIESNGVVYVLYNKTAGWYKKIHVKELSYDSMWHIVMSNIDNSDSVYLNVNKHDYPKRMFVYYNVLTNQLLDREPDSDQWDLLWTKYKTMIDYMGGKIPYSVSGILTNRNHLVAQNEGKKCGEVWLSTKTAAYQNHISTIGSDWKTYNVGNNTYSISDTFVYFIRTVWGTDTSFYKMAMNSFVGGGQGKTKFNLFQTTLGIQDKNLDKTVKVYPNPSSQYIHIESENSLVNAVIYDMQGREVLHSNQSTIEVSTLNSGIYMMLVQTDKGIMQQTIIKE